MPAVLGGVVAAFVLVGVARVLSYRASLYACMSGARARWVTPMDRDFFYDSSPANGCSGAGRGPLTAVAVRDDGAMAYISGPGDRDGGTLAG
jgi:hypothetical protein